MWQRSTWIKVSIAYQQDRKIRNWKFKKTKSIHWLFIDYEIDGVYETLKDKEKESGDSIWWYDSRYGFW